MHGTDGKIDFQQFKQFSYHDTRMNLSRVLKAKKLARRWRSKAEMRAEARAREKPAFIPGPPRADVPAAPLPPPAAQRKLESLRTPTMRTPMKKFVSQ